MNTMKIQPPASVRKLESRAVKILHNDARGRELSLPSFLWNRMAESFLGPTASNIREG